MTWAPALARARAAARPMPRDAPVTSTVFPLQGDIVGLHLLKLSRERSVGPNPLDRSGCSPRLGVQEHGGVGDEQFRVLVMRSVAGVRIDDELPVRQMLLQREAVDRRDDQVVAA